MTPMDMGQKTVEGLTSSICFRHRTGSFLAAVNTRNTKYKVHRCLSLETVEQNIIRFMNVSNPLLLELVTTIQREWLPGIRGVSMGVASVITDYTTNMPPVLATHPQLRDERYIQLEGSPWQAGQEDPMATESLQLAIIACLTREGYRLSMDINMEPKSRIFFFIRNLMSLRTVRIPNKSGAGLGEKDGLTVYRPMVVKSRSSFLGKYAALPRYNKRKTSQKAQTSLRRKSATRPVRVMGYKPVQDGAWWQQTSTDVSFEKEDSED